MQYVSMAMYRWSVHIAEKNHELLFNSNRLSTFFVSFCRITFCHLPFQSKWLYVGTERGNTHIVNIESFILSGYVIMWNKAIEL